MFGSVDYNRRDEAVEAKVEELLGKMSLAEKVGQLVQVDPPMPHLEKIVREGRAGSILSIGDVARINRLQRIATEESRLGIPLIIGNDVIHGYRTTFPIPLAETCSWDMDLLERTARAAAEEASASGTDWIFAPMVDIARDPRWGRIAESAGEDPFLGSAAARARVRGFQADGLQSGRRVVSCPKHYVAYGAAEAGRDYNTVDVSERTLREVYLPPFKAAIDAGAGSTMSAFNEISGVPATANAFTLRTILRDEWGWGGVVLSDFNAIRELIAHGVAADLKDAGRLALTAGVDVDMMGHSYSQYLEGLVNEGAVPIELVEEAVRRVLRLKLQLGLFERPYVDEGLASSIQLRDDARELALEAARECMVLLKNNDKMLPLAGGNLRLAVIGPLADDRHAPLGCWAGGGRPEDVETVLAGLRSVQGAEVKYVRGCDVRGEGAPDIDGAVEAAGQADAVIAVLGEDADMSGEAHSRAYLELPGRQQELFDALCATGKPVVVVLMTGRPLVIPEVAERAQAVLLAWHAGIRTGQAVADILFGVAAPSGRLAISFPRAVGQIPVYYAQKPTGRPAEGAGTKQFEEAFRSSYMDVPNSPLFPFGFGLSYTRFEYSDLSVETPTVQAGGELVVSALVRNSGEREGVEVVQLYVRDEVGSTTRPVKELKGFELVRLGPGEQRKVQFRVPAQELCVWNLKMQYTAEPGSFRVWVAPDSVSGLEAQFEVR